MHSYDHTRATRRRFLERTLEGLLATGWLPMFSGCDQQDVDAFVQAMTSLGQQINAYRQQNGLPAIPASPKLGTVAFGHTLDIFAYHPEKQCNGNLHSWSTNWSAPVKGGCYDPNNPATWPIMWDKPKELANYGAYGYEIAASGCFTAAEALDLWKQSAPHNDVILSKGIWTGYKWQALGTYVGKGFACAWFGEIADAG